MGEKLFGMEQKEIWQLCPVFLTGHRECWADWYQEEEGRLRALLPKSRLRRISHIGSTSIAGIWAKPIIDILVEVSGGCDLADMKEILEGNGYLCISQGKTRISFHKGCTQRCFEEKVYHLHLRYAGDNDELYFRDYLIDCPEVAREYEIVKIKIWKKYGNDWDGYANAKNDFVSRYTKEAKKLYGNCYEV